MATGDKSGIALDSAIMPEHLTKIIDSVETYTFKHIQITGVAGSPNVVKIIPGAVGVNKIEVDSVAQSIYCNGYNGEKEVPAFPIAANYAAMKNEIKIISEQEQEIKMDFGDGSYPQVNSSGEILLKLYKSGIGNGYNNTTNCYCTLTISKI